MEPEFRERPPLIVIDKNGIMRCRGWSISVFRKH
jgi:hypothetical protein